MRDPKRIPITLSIIETLWEENPQLRLMQMLMNSKRNEWDGYDDFYLEDEDLAERLMDMYHGKTTV